RARRGDQQQQDFGSLKLERPQEQESRVGRTLIVDAIGRPDLQNCITASCDEADEEEKQEKDCRRTDGRALVCHFCSLPVFHRIRQWLYSFTLLKIYLQDKPPCKAACVSDLTFSQLFATSNRQFAH